MIVLGAARMRMELRRHSCPVGVRSRIRLARARSSYNYAAVSRVYACRMPFTALHSPSSEHVLTSPARARAEYFLISGAAKRALGAVNFLLALFSAP